MKTLRVPSVVLGVLICLVTAGRVGAAAPASDPPAFEAFAAWAAGHKAVGVAADEAEGVRLAKARREAMRELIQRDPRRALALAWPEAERTDFPKAVADALEQPVRAQGRYRVVFACPGEGQTAPEPMIRTVELDDGRFFYAYTFGRRRHQLSSARTPILGVAAGDRLALSDRLYRVLTTEEARRLDPGVLPVRGDCPVCGEALAGGEPSPVLIDVGGEVVALHAENEAAAYLSAAGIAGIWAAGGTGSTGESSPVIPPTTSQGDKRFLFMRVRFADDSPTYEPSSDATVRADLESVIQRYQEMSYGTLQGRYAFTPTMTLPKPRSGYMNGWSSIDGMNALMDDAKAAANALEDPPGSGIYPYRPADFDLFVARWNGEPGGCCSYGGGGNAWIRWDGSDVLVHEWGHAIGLPHANSWDPGTDDPIGPGTHTEYGNVYDNMGNGGWRHYSAMKKAWMNWLPPERVHEIRADGTYRIHVHDQPALQPGNRYVARIARYERDDYQYWLEYRNHSVTGANAAWWVNGIGVMRDRDGQLLDMTPGSARGKDDCTLLVGRTYSDVSAGIHITPVAAGNDGQAYIDVAVRMDDPASPNHAPVMTLTASSLEAAAGAPITFAALSEDPDGDDLAYAWDFGADPVDTVNVSTRQRSWGAAGSYTVRCVVSDRRGGTASQSVVVRIGATAASSALGMVVAEDGAPIPNAQVRDGTGRLAFADTDGTYRMAGLPAGSHTLQAVRHPRVFTPDARGVQVAPDALGADFASHTPMGPGTGLVREYWLNLPGETLSSLTRNARYPDQPDGAHHIAEAFEIPEDWGTDYGSRLRGYFVPPMSGGYRFYLASDDESTLYLGRTEDPGQRVQIARVSGWTSPRDWTANASQTSDLLQLAAGQLYYIEAVHKEGAGGDHLAVGVDLPDGTTERPIPYHRLLPFGAPTAAEAVVTVEMTVPHAIEGGTPAVMTLRRTGTTADPLDVYLHVSGTAQYGVDYPALALVQPFAGGMDTLTIPIEAINDRSGEPAKTVRIRPAAGPGYRVGDAAQATAILVDNDGAPTMTVVAADPYASPEGSDPGRFEIRRLGDASDLLTVAYSVGGSAAAGTDYEPLPGSVTLQPGQPVAEVYVAPIAVAGEQPPMTVVLTVTAGTGYTVGSPAGATVTLSQPGPGFGILREWWTGIDGGNVADLTGSGHYPASPTGRAYVTGLFEGPRDWEDNYGTRFRGTFVAPMAGNYRFWVASDDGGELWLGTGAGAETSRRIAYVDGWTNYRDWTAQTNQRSAAILLQAGNRYYIEALHKEGGGGDHISVGVQFPNGTMERPLSTQWLEPWADGAPPVALLARRPVATESGQPGQFTLKRAGDPGSPLTVYLSRSGTATPGADYAAFPGSVTFGAGESSVTLPVHPIPDAATEGPESIVLTLAAGTGYSRGVSDTATVTIAGDPPRASIQALDPGADEAGDQGTFRIALVSPSFGPVTIQYQLGGTASPGIDYPAMPGTVHVPAGLTTATLHILPEADAENEPDETIVLALLPGDGYLPDPNTATASITITNTPTQNAAPVLTAIANPAEGILLTIHGDGGTDYILEQSTDLDQWQPIQTNSSPTLPLIWPVPETPNNPAEFYRIRLGP
jgi:hypothetical protein